MNKGQIFDRILKLAAHLDGDDAKQYDYLVNHPDVRDDEIFGIVGILAGLVLDLREDLIADACKSAGRGKNLSAAKRIIKTAKDVVPARTNMHGAWMADGKQCYCDGFRAVRLVDPLPVENIPDYLEPIDLDLIYGDIPQNKGRQLDLPSVGELKAHIKMEKAKPDRDRDSRIHWDFGDVMVDASFLIDMLEILPDCKAYAANYKVDIRSIYFESAAGDGLLLPCKKY